MSKGKKRTMSSTRKMENVMKEAAFWVKRKKKSLPSLYKGIMDIRMVGIKCYLWENKQGYKNVIEAEKLSNS